MNPTALREDLRDVSDDLLAAIHYTARASGLALLPRVSSDRDRGYVMNFIALVADECKRRAELDPPHSPGCVCHDCAGARIEVTND